MASVNITIPDDVLDRVVHALCVSAGLEESAANAKEALIQHIRRTVANVERTEAQEAALLAISEPDVDGLAS